MTSIDQYLGAASFPLDPSEVVATETFQDPVRKALLEMILAATLAELEEQWNIIRVGTVLRSKSPVEDHFPGLPTPARLQERVGLFPALFIDRTGAGEFSAVGKQYDSVTCPWEVTWCLGPLSTGEEHRFRAAMTVLFPNLVKLICVNGRHPAYNGGVTPFGPGGIPLRSLDAKSFDAASAEVPVGEKKQLFYGVTVTLETIEDGGFTGAEEGVPFLASTHTIRVGGHEGLVPGILDLDTSHPSKKP